MTLKAVAVHDDPRQTFTMTIKAIAHMRRAKFLTLYILFLATGVVPAAGGGDVTAATDHGDPARSGRFIVSGLTWQRVAQVHMDHAFDGSVEGRIAAQSLYWTPCGSTHGLVIVATEAGTVYGLDAMRGRPVWRTILGTPVPQSLLPCGNIDPVAVTGTPVIDPRSATLYVDSLVDDHGDPRHRVFALRLDDGSFCRDGLSISRRRCRLSASPSHLHSKISVVLGAD